VQLQQVLMNLMLNAWIDEDVDGTRELAIKSQRAENEQVCGDRQRYWSGLPAQQGTRSLRRSYHQASRHGYGTLHQPVDR